MVRIVATSDKAVKVDDKGYYKLRITYNGEQSVTPYCINYHASASELQDAINSHQLDFSSDGSYSSDSDNDHIIVSRNGDGSVTSGYGYTYTLQFSGPTLYSGRSSVLGNAPIAVEVVDEGKVR